MDKDEVGSIHYALPLAIKYTVVGKWRSPADGVAGLGGLTTCNTASVIYRVQVESTPPLSQDSPMSYRVQVYITPPLS